MSNSISDLVLTNECFLVKPDYASPVKPDFDMLRNVVQYAGTTTFISSLDSLNSALSPFVVDMAFTNLVKADEYDIIDFFSKHRGRHMRFWCPSWVSNYFLANDIEAGAVQVDIVPIGMIEGFYLQGQNEWFFILLKNGDIIIRRIANTGGYTSNGIFYETFDLSTPIDRDIKISDVSIFGKLFLGRFDTDTLSMKHMTTSVSSCSLKVVELINEYDQESFS